MTLDGLAGPPRGPRHSALRVYQARLADARERRRDLLGTETAILATDLPPHLLTDQVCGLLGGEVCGLTGLPASGRGGGARERTVRTGKTSTGIGGRSS